MARSGRVRSADTSRFAMVPRPDVPRSVFRSEMTHKTTFDAGLLIPIYVDEILPGDSMKLELTAFCRLATPLFPVMDNLYLDTFFFFVPNRLVWDNWKRFMGEQAVPGATTSFLVPQIATGLGGQAPLTIYDYFGIPVQGQIDGGGALSINALPLRCYNLIYQEWFKDQNVQTSTPFIHKGDGPDDPADYFLRRRGKRHDYFTSCLPWPMKETSLTPVDGIPWVGGAPISGLGAFDTVNSSGPVSAFVTGRNIAEPFAQAKELSLTGTNKTYMKLDGLGYPDVRVKINDMRLAFAAQRLMERDARGGTRYTELIRAHFGVVSPDARLQRPEYLGGGSSPITINPVVQSSASSITGSDTPLGQLGAIGTGLVSGHRASGTFTEHGHVIGLACVRADLTYQQGLARFWRRRTKYDFYWPAFAHLGEQAVTRKEIYALGTGDDNLVFGYQERWAEYRQMPNRISGLFRSTTANAIDQWHLAQRFTSAPVLGDTFILENPPVERVLAVGAEAAGQQFLFDSLFSVRMTRPIPTFSVPGLADHF